MATDADIIANARTVIDGVIISRQKFSEIDLQIKELNKNLTAPGADAKVAEIRAEFDAAIAEANVLFGAARIKLKKDYASSLYVGSAAKIENELADNLYASFLAFRDTLAAQIVALPSTIANAKVTVPTSADPASPATTNASSDSPNSDDNGQGNNREPAKTSTGPYAASSDTGINKQKDNSQLKENNPYSTSIRRWNPLSSLSSYTYNLTLYLMTPEGANYFSTTGKLDPNNIGAYIVAQSGGVDGLEARAITLDPDGRLGIGKPGLDYYIDDVNLSITLFAANVGTTVTFKVIEPQGFTFLTRLTKASSQINKISRLINQGSLPAAPNLYQQHYMLGVKFYGYDATGNIIEARSFTESPITLDDPYAIYERLFPITVSKVDFAVNGKATTYNFETTITPNQAAFATKRGYINGNAEFQGATVGEMLGNAESKNTTSMIGWLNNDQQVRTDKNLQTITQTYDIDWGEYKEILNSKMIMDADYEPASAPSSPAVKTSQQSNASAASRAVTIDKNSVIRGISPTTTIVGAIDMIITKSSYIRDALINNNNSKIQADSIDNTPRYFQWYTINPVSKIVGIDSKLGDWAYNITYQIRPLQVPYVRSPYVKTKSKYYGPLKMYSYNFTGENTEVVDFEMTYNNLFFTSVADTPDNKKVGQKKPSAPVAVSPSASSTTSGRLNKADDQVNSVRAVMTSIADQATAIITIMGDPDLLMTSIGHAIPSGLNQENFLKFYSLDGSISPYAGQVYIEIIFKIAEDYLDTGLLDVSAYQDVQFYPIQEQEIHKAKGLVYKIQDVTSTFLKGKFEQVLNLIMVSSAELIYDDEKNNADYNRSEMTRLARTVTPVATNQREPSIPSSPPPAPTAPASSPSPNTSPNPAPRPVPTEAEGRRATEEVNRPGTRIDTRPGFVPPPTA